MISVILWKEYREHRAFWLVFAVLAVGTLIGVPIVFASDFERDSGLRESFAVAGLVLAWAYAMICGGMMFAGEREAKTDSFLDTLPGGRHRVWVAKCIAGSIFVGAYALGVAVIVATSSLVERSDWLVGILVLPVSVALGFGWGLVTSAFARTVLGAIGLAIAVQCLFTPAVIAVSILFVAFTQFLFPRWLVEPLFLAFLALACLFPLRLSSLAYTRVDRNRRRTDEMKPGLLADFRRQAKAMLWLSARQIRGLTFWLLPLAFVLGLLTIPQPLLFWPLVTLILGTVCGVTCFLDEQDGPRRFLGDQRYPLGTVWGIKVGLRFLLLFISLFAAIVPLLVLLFIDLGSRSHDRASQEALSGRLFRSRLVGFTIPTGVMLFAPALTGFAVGLLSGIVFRKAFIAVMAGVALALFALGVWVPGLLIGGVPSWQVFLVPVILLVAARLLMRPWTAERLLTRRVVLAMIGLIVCCVLLLGLGLRDRVESIPDSPTREEVLARMPKVGENETGLLVRSILSTIKANGKEWNAEKPTKPLRQREKRESANISDFQRQQYEVIHRGWPDEPMDQIELAGWLDRVFADEVWKRFDSLPNLPLGIVEDPRRMDNTARFLYFDLAHQAGQLLLVRGLQNQKKGDPEVFVKHLEITLALVRNLRNLSPQFILNYSRSTDAIALNALDHWLSALSGRADLLKRVGIALRRHRNESDSANRNPDLAEYIMARNTLDNPVPWLQESFRQREYEESAGTGPSVRLGNDVTLIPEENLISFVSNIPWEHERQERLLLRYFYSQDVQRKSDSLMMPGRRMTADWHDKRHCFWLTRLEAARLMVALRHHQATTGKPATDLTQLVPASIDAIPSDPFDGNRFR